MDSLHALLGSRVKAQILRLLFGVTQQEMHLREIARQAGMNEATVRQELGKLADLGVVESRRAGNRLYFRAAAAHPLYPELRRLVLKTSGLVDVLRAVLTAPGIQVAFVFGSLAASPGSAESDVDLLVIGDIGLRQLAAMMPDAAATLGREINPHVMTPAEVRRRTRSEDRFLATVLAAPKLFVIGDERDLAGLAR